MGLFWPDKSKGGGAGRIVHIGFVWLGTLYFVFVTIGVLYSLNMRGWVSDDLSFDVLTVVMAGLVGIVAALIGRGLRYLIAKE